MPVRIGVDVGGTFTKAVACAVPGGQIVARSVTPTTHGHPAGIAAGVAASVEEVASTVAERHLGPILSVAHSTTQAVNALLEGDTATVGVLGIGRRPDLALARRRTRVESIRLAPGRHLHAVSRFIDATDGLDEDAARSALDELREAGAEAICVSEAYAVEDPQVEERVTQLAADVGMPACGGHELTGLYGLEMRTVTAALNAGILPMALATAEVVQAAVDRVAPGSPLLVMRGDGGAADVRAVRRHPLLTAFSGPAASVAGVLRHTDLADGIVLEVGGTSTNVSIVRGGRPVLSYVRVLEHLTAVRSLDVRVAGVGGGSLLRLARRWGRTRLAEVGPRSAHIAGLPYASFADAATIAGAEARLVAPRAGDPAAYAVLVAADGRQYAITLTCAANAVGAVPPGTYAEADAEVARLAFAALGRLTGQPGERLALEALDLATAKVLPIVDDMLSEHRLARPELVGVGGGAGALAPRVAERRRLRWRIPDDAEVISSVGDALSLVRIELERAVTNPTRERIASLHREAEAAAIEAGADPETLQIESEPVPERSALRVTATGAFALGRPGDRVDALATADLAARAAAVLGPDARLGVAIGPHALFVIGVEGAEQSFVVLDRAGSVATEGRGTVLEGPARDVATRLRDRLPGLTRHIGPVAVAPAIRVLRGKRLVDLSLLSRPERALEAVLEECELAADDPIVVLVTRS